MKPTTERLIIQHLLRYTSNWYDTEPLQLTEDQVNDLYGRLLDLQESIEQTP